MLSSWCSEQNAVGQKTQDRAAIRPHLSQWWEGHSHTPTSTTCDTFGQIYTEKNHKSRSQNKCTVFTSNVISITEVRSRSARLLAGTWRPLVSVITTLYYVAIIFHRRVWYHALSLRYACIRSLGIILILKATFVPNLVSFTGSIAELAHAEHCVLNHSLTHPASLMTREPKLLLENKQI